MPTLRNIWIAVLLGAMTAPGFGAELPGAGKTARPVVTEDPAALFQVEVVGLVLG